MQAKKIDAFGRIFCEYDAMTFLFYNTKQNKKNPTNLIISYWQCDFCSCLLGLANK